MFVGSPGPDHGFREGIDERSQRDDEAYACGKTLCGVGWAGGRAVLPSTALARTSVAICTWTTSTGAPRTPDSRCPATCRGAAASATGRSPEPGWPRARRCSCPFQCARDRPERARPAVVGTREGQQRSLANAAVRVAGIVGDVSRRELPEESGYASGGEAISVTRESSIRSACLSPNGCSFSSALQRGTTRRYSLAYAGSP